MNTFTGRKNNMPVEYNTLLYFYIHKHYEFFSGSDEAFH